VLLAIDTSAGTSVAVVDRDRGILAQADEADTRRHAEVIGTLIERVLAESGVAPRELSGVVAGMGPGPFTGLRVGIAAARAFAFGIGKPVVPLVSHDALALDASEPLLVVTDARRREVAWSTYRPSDETASRSPSTDTRATSAWMPRASPPVGSACSASVSSPRDVLSARANRCICARRMSHPPPDRSE